MALLYGTGVNSLDVYLVSDRPAAPGSPSHSRSSLTMRRTRPDRPGSEREARPQVRGSDALAAIILRLDAEERAPLNE